MSKSNEQHNNHEAVSKTPERIVFHLNLNAQEYQTIWTGLDRLYQRYESTPFWDTQVEIRMLIDKLMSEFLAQMEAFHQGKAAPTKEE